MSAALSLHRGVLFASDFNGGRNGFTFVELVTVIVLLGVLSAMVVPKMANLADSANASVGADFKGGLSSAVAMTHAKWMTSGRPSFLSLQSNGSAVKLYFNSAGYPVSTNGMSSIGGQNGNCVAVANSILTIQTAVDKTVIDVGGDPGKYKWCVKAGFHGWQPNTGEEVCNFTLIKRKGTSTASCYPGASDQVVTYYPGTGKVVGSGF